MAIFGKTETAESLIKKIEANKYEGREGLESMLAKLAELEDFDPAKALWMVGHGNRGVREFAHTQLAPIKGKLAVERVVKEMDGKPPSLRREIAKLLTDRAPYELAGLLGSMLYAKEDEKRETALDIIAASAVWPEFLNQLKVLARDPSARIRKATARLLVEQAEQTSIFLLLRSMLHDDDDAVRHVVIEALAQNPSIDIVDPFFERLSCEEGATRRVILAALTDLARRQVGNIEERILPVLADEDPELRQAAGRLLNEMPERARALRAFFVHCRGLAPFLRGRSMQAILETARDLAEPLTTLMADPELEILVPAMMMAANLRDERVIPFATSVFLGQEDWWVRSIAADILANFSSPEIVATILQRKDDGDMRYSVISALSRIDAAEVIPPLLEALRDEKRGIRMVAIDAVARFEQENVTAALLELVRTDPEPSVVEKAAAVLDERESVSREMLKRARQDNSAEVVDLSTTLEMVNERLNDHA